MENFLCCCPLLQILRSFKADSGPDTEMSSNSVSDSNSIKDGNEEDQDSGTASGDHGQHERPLDVPAAVTEQSEANQDNEPENEGTTQESNAMNANEAADDNDDGSGDERPEVFEGADGKRGRDRNRDHHQQQDTSQENDNETDESWRDQQNHGHEKHDSRRGRDHD